MLNLTHSKKALHNADYTVSNFTDKSTFRKVRAVLNINLIL